MTFGVVPTGFNPMTLQDILAGIEADEQSLIDPAIDTSSATPLGQINGIMAERFATLWEVAEACYHGIDPGAAEGAQLYSTALITGTVQESATPSRVTCNVTLTAGTVFPIGAIIAVATQPTIQFTSTEALTPVANGTYPIVFICNNTGPIPAFAGTLTTIVTPVSGWSAVTNPLDAVLGSTLETDTALRIRRQNEIVAAGGSTVDDIRADLLRIVNADGSLPVQQAFVFENTSDVTDANGVPPHSINAVIYDGVTPSAANLDVGNVIWRDKGSGVRAFGGTSQAVTDSAGNPQTVAFDRAAVVPVYLSLTVTTDVTYPTNGGALVKAACVSRASSVQNLGLPVVAAQYISAALTVQGVTDATIALGFAPSPTLSANLAISLRAIGAIDSSRILVNGV